MGAYTKNETKLKALEQGINIAIKEGYNKLIVEGDSMVIIQMLERMQHVSDVRKISTWMETRGRY
jgi:hypothetical protein